MTYRRIIPASEAQRRQWVNANAKHVGKKCVYRDPVNPQGRNALADAVARVAHLRELAAEARKRGDMVTFAKLGRRIVRIKAFHDRRQVRA